MPESATSVTVVDNAEKNRYEAHVGGDLAGFVTYQRRPGVVVFVHTEVADAFEGLGVASQLASVVLGEARAHGWQVDPVCPFIAGYIDRHPEFADLVVGANDRPPA
jgi:predicted GNAT family acetyltransferase